MSSEYQNRVRRNLEQPVPASHPTADVLTAYAEHTLSAREQQEVVQHLSVCADCREVVYLAGEAEEEPATPVASLPETRRFRWWTWALPLTAVVAIGSVVLLQGPLSVRKAPVATPPIAQSSAPADLQPSTTNEIAAKSQTEPQAATAPKPLRQKTITPPAVALKQTDQLAKLDRYEAQPNLSAGLISNAPVAAPPPPAPVAMAKAKAEPAAASAATTVDVTAETPVLTQPAPTRDAVEEKDAYRFSAQATRRDTDKKALAGMGANLARRDWLISPQGRLQHLVNGSYIEVPLAPVAHFNVVAASGVNVWVAGKNLALFHSADDGITWQPQSLPAQPPADILRLQAADALNLSLATSAGQTFLTHDGGKTWVALEPAKPR